MSRQHLQHLWSHPCHKDTPGAAHKDTQGAAHKDTPGAAHSAHHRSQQHKSYMLALCARTFHVQPPPVLTPCC